MNKQYTWVTEEYCEYWKNDTFDTVDECIEDFKEQVASGEIDTQEHIFIGECVPFTINVNSRLVIEKLEEDVCDNVGDIEEDWISEKTLKDWDELDEQLTKVVCNWLKKHNEMHSFYSVENIRKVEVK